MHGGKVWAESAVGEGSLFHVTLPVAANDAELGVRRGSAPATSA